MERINRLRDELSELVRTHGIQHPKVIRKSQQLDKFILQYMKRFPTRRAPLIPTKQVDKSSYFRMKVRSALRREADEYFARLEQLQQEIDKLSDELHPFDHAVIEKSRELDRLIMNFIRPKR